MARPLRQSEPSNNRSQRWTDREWIQVQRQAKRAGYTTSEYLRSLVLTHGAVQRRAAKRARERAAAPEPKGQAFVRESIERATAPKKKPKRKRAAKRDPVDRMLAAVGSEQVIGHDVGPDGAITLHSVRFGDPESEPKPKPKPKPKRKPSAHELADQAPAIDA